MNANSFVITRTIHHVIRWRGRYADYLVLVAYRYDIGVKNSFEIEKRDPNYVRSDRREEVCAQESLRIELFDEIVGILMEKLGIHSLRFITEPLSSQYTQKRDIVPIGLLGKSSLKNLERLILRYYKLVLVYWVSEVVPNILKITE